MVPAVYTIDEIRDIVTPIAQRYGVQNVFLFGSYARHQANAESDIDLRIDKGKAVSALALGGLYADLEDALQKPVDVLTTQMLSERFLDRIQQDEVQVYAS